MFKNQQTAKKCQKVELVNKNQRKNIQEEWLTG